jgi:hypothetical protein
VWWLVVEVGLAPVVDDDERTAYRAAMLAAETESEFLASMRAADEDFAHFVWSGERSHQAWRYGGTKRAQYDGIWS